MAHNYLRHRRGGAGFYEELSSDSEEYEEHDELDPVEGENVAELGIILDDDFLEEDGVCSKCAGWALIFFNKSYAGGR